MRFSVAAFVVALTSTLALAAPAAQEPTQTYPEYPSESSAYSADPSLAAYQSLFPSGRLDTRFAQCFEGSTCSKDCCARIAKQTRQSRQGEICAEACPEEAES